MGIRERLLTCDKEEIHLIGSVQSFAVLLGFNRAHLRLEVLSQNSRELNPALDPDRSIGLHWDEIFDSRESISEMISGATPVKEVDLTLNFKNGGGSCRFVAFTSPTHLILEHELLASNQEITAGRILESLHKVSSTRSVELGEKELADQLAMEVKKITGIDRVMVYKFHEDLHGEVIAERKEAHLESYLGLHYPESDIPRQARVLYARNLIRLIADVNSPPVPLVSSALAVDRFDLSDSISRSVSPVHIQYLRNMGVSASMSISIMARGKLWGLVACHHYSPKFVSFFERSYCATLGHTFSSRVVHLESLAIQSSLAEANRIIIDVLSEVSNRGFGRISVDTVWRSLKRREKDILSIMKAHGFFLQVNEVQLSLGKTPRPDALERLRKHMMTQGESGQVFICDETRALDLRLDDETGSNVGVIAIGSNVSVVHCMIAWFRPEQIQTISWGGENEKTIVNDNGIERLTPRGSFKEFKKVQHGRSENFSIRDERVAKEFLWLFTNLLLVYLKDSKAEIEGLTEAAKAKDQFIGVISHELRTPLNNILGWLQLYRDRFRLDPDLNEVMEVVEKSAQNQLQLVNDLLDVSRINSGKLQFSMKMVDFVHLVRDLTQHFEPTLRSKEMKISFETNVKSALIHGDPYRLQQVVTNLIQNSIKFSPRGGEIHLSLEEREASLRLTCRDFGEGIAPDRIHRIFESFYQATKSASRVHKGLGLGLAISKNIVELHGGRISISSEGLGKGVEVVAEFPVPTGMPETKVTGGEGGEEARLSSSQRLRNNLILLVEDTVESARFVTLALERAGAKVVCAETAMEALKILNSGADFDLVLSDIGLPHMDGYEFIRKARELAEMSSIPFVALSAYGSQEDIRRSIEAGFSSHVVKPVSLSHLLKVVTAMIGDAHGIEEPS